MRERDITLSIQTPEGVVFPLQIASPASRLLALLVDKLCIYTIAALLSFLAKCVGVVSQDLAGAFFVITSFAVSIGYAVCLEWFWRGRTIGKHVLKIRVMDSQGLRLQFSQIVIRNLLRFVDALPAFYLVGGLSTMLTAHGQRLGDLVANTIVAQAPDLFEPDLDEVLPDKYNSFREYPHLAARLRQKVTSEQAGILLRALLRRETLELEARLSLFRTLRENLEPIAAFPAEITDGISDEQYVRNVVDILFR